MSKFAFFAALRSLKNNNGVINGQPRILNVDTGNSWYGYAEINTTATSPFSRTKIHTGRFQGDSDIANGSLIEDKSDNSRYLVMSTKGMWDSNIRCYWDATLFYTNITCDIQRWSSGTKDFFGKETINTPTTIASGVYIMVNPLTLDVVDQPDVVTPKDKMKVAIQSTYGIQEKDRLVTSVGDIYMVKVVDRSSLIDQQTGKGLHILHVDMDVR